MATATMKPTTVRFDEGLKSQAVAILDSIGLNLNTYLTLSLRQLVNQRRVPFELAPAPEVPNEKTRRAMLSRARCMQRAGALVVNFPGSTRAATECWEGIADQFEHAVKMSAGGGHGAPAAGGAARV